MLASFFFNFCYLVATVALVPYFAYQAWTKGKYRGGWPEKILGRVPPRVGDNPCVWLHAVSVGEVNLLPTVVGPLRKRLPDWTFVITTTTITGLVLARKRFPNDCVCYCPLDFSWAVGTAMRRIRPNLLVLAELELWPNLIQQARAQGAKVAVVNARLSDRSFRGYRRFSWLLRNLFQQLDFVGAQSAEYAQRFVQLGVPQAAIQITGSVKFDGAETQRDNPRTRRLKQAYNYQAEPVFLAGSTGGSEELFAIQAFQAAHKINPRLRLILAPRHTERSAEIQTLLRQHGLVFEQRSSPLVNRRGPFPQVLLIDVVGELADWWGVAEIGFVGGTLYPRGGQNMIEPAAYGVAVCHGPDYRNFRDVVALFQRAKAQHIVQSPEELKEFVIRCLTDHSYAQQLGIAAAEVVRQSQGAARLTIDRLDALCGAQKQDQAPKAAA